MIWILLLFILVPIIHSIAASHLKEKKNRVTSAFSSMNDLFVRRNDLSPSLMAVVNPELTQERELIMEAVALRQQSFAGTLSDDEKIDLDKKYAKAISSILAAAQKNTRLKESEQFLKMQSALTHIETELSTLRQTYNDAVKDYNHSLKTFPTNIIGSLMDLHPRKMFDS